MRRSVVYLLGAALGFLFGAGLGIYGRTCSHPEQPPFLECVFGDPRDVLLPAIGLALLATAIVAAVDVARGIARKHPDSPIPRWRLWVYAGLLILVALPAVRIAVEQVAGGYSDADPLLVFLFGTLVLTPVILVEFVLWLRRRFSGVERLAPIAAVIAIGAFTFVATSDPDLACVRDGIDTTGCYSGMRLVVTTFVVLSSMVGAFFWSRRASLRPTQLNELEPIDG